MKSKVLVVDDEVHITTLLRATLRMYDYEVVVAYDGVEALEKVDSEKPDIIILDIKMPRLDGWGVCKQLKTDERTKKIPIIILTAYGQAADCKKSLEVGADKFMTKPFEIPNLLDLIQKLLKKDGSIGGGS